MILSQLEASSTYIAAEAAAAEILAKSPTVLPLMQLIVADWAKFQGGKLTSADEASLLKAVVVATKQKISPVAAAILDGATQQVLANQNLTAPTAISGAAAAILSDVVNGIARAVTVYTAPATVAAS